MITSSLFCVFQSRLAPALSSTASRIFQVASLVVSLVDLTVCMAVNTACDAGARAFAQQPRLFVGVRVILEIILIMSIYAEALGLCGLIVPKSNATDCEELG